MFNARATEPACNGECPRYTPAFYHGSHFGSPLRPFFSGDSSTKTGQSQVWYSIGKFWNSTPKHFWSGVFPSSSIYRMLYLWHAALKEKGRIMELTTSCHNMVAWRRRIQLPSVNDLILRSTISFLWWEPTPEYLMWCSQFWTASLNRGSENLLLSAL